MAKVQASALNLNSLMTAKKASGRSKDLDDIKNLQA